MSRELYFLRSSEQKIVQDMLQFAYSDDAQNLNQYSEFYGLTTKDLGLYALVDNEIAGAIWSRELNGNKVPLLSVAVLPKFEDQEVAHFMMEQFLQEAAVVYDEVSIDISHKQEFLSFYESFGFLKNNEDFILLKRLEKKEIVRPSDGYDPKKWMD